MTVRAPSRVLILDRQPAFAHGVASLLRAEHDFVALPPCLSVAEASKGLGAVPFDVLALGLPLDGDPVALCREARAAHPRLRAALFFEAGDGALVDACSRQLPSTVLLRDASVQAIVGGLRALVNGVGVATSSAQEEAQEGVLSDQERRIIELIGQGLTSAETASVLCLAPNTVRSYCQSILRKLGARNRAHALELARSQGLLDVLA